MSWIGRQLQGKAATPEDVELMQEKLLFDRVPVRDRYIRFFILVGLSTIIAAYGVIVDSTATVIGAMIVAPLMTPIMAVALSVVTGDARNIIRSSLIVLAGAAFVVGLSYLLVSHLTGHLALPENSQVTARVTPNLIDLIIALAAGAAGAFASGREDISDALPGVAIAVALVPPLAVVGVCISAGEWKWAMGALLLFLTNLVAMQGAGVMVFAIMGFGGAAHGQKIRKVRRIAIIAIVISILIIMVPLGVTFYSVFNAVGLREDGRKAVSEWLEGSRYNLVEITVDGKEINTLVAGEGELPEFDELLSILAERTSDVQIDVNVVPERTLSGTIP